MNTSQSMAQALPKGQQTLTIQKPVLGIVNPILQETYTQVVTAQFILVQASYSEEKSQIILVFSGEKERLIERHLFHPLLFLPLHLPVDLLKKILFPLNGNIEIKKREKSIQLKAKNFETLKKAFHLIIKSFSINPSLIEPERQFLLLNNLNYFDSFQLKLEKLIKNNDEPNEDFILNEINKSFSISLTPEELKLIKPKVINSILSRIPLNNDRTTEQEFSDLISENILFKSCLAVNNSYNHQTSLLKEKKIILNLGFTWLSMIEEKNFLELNCECCVPEHFNETNILSSSKLELKPLIDGLQYLSFTGEVKGTYFKNSVFKAFLKDALKMQEEGSAVISSNKHLEWFCTKNKNAFLENLQEVKELNSTYSKKELNNLLWMSLIKSFNEKQLNAFFIEQKLILNEIQEILSKHTSRFSLSPESLSFSSSNSIEIINELAHLLGDIIREKAIINSSCS